MIYIANSFKTVGRTAVARGGWPVDNDPHFWNSPPTWGICRPDLRKKATPGQTIFFVLSKNSQHPQMIFGYLQIKRIVSHLSAHRSLPQKRMRGLMPDGNIIVTATGRYNRWDGQSHQHNFQKIRGKYAIGDPQHSRFLTAEQIENKAAEFLSTLGEVLGFTGTRAIDLISRAGRQSLTDVQVKALKKWVDKGLSESNRGFNGTSSRMSSLLSPIARKKIACTTPKFSDTCGPGHRFQCSPRVRLPRSNC